MFKSRNPEFVPRSLHVSKTLNRLTVFREKSPVESFYIQKHKSIYDSCESVSIVDDVYMLFNQQRLDRMTNSALSTWLQNTSRTDSQLASLRSRMTDEQLGLFIKSRYIQSRSELLAWSGYLESMYPEISAPSGPGLSGPGLSGPGSSGPGLSDPAPAPAD